MSAENRNRRGKYKNYSEYEKEHLVRVEMQTAASAGLPAYHIRPKSGLLNDPNGFSYYNGLWRLFYQAFPFGAVHGAKSWAAVVSRDLVRWEYRGLALLPDTEFDSHGVFSGSALTIGDEFLLFYTGNARSDDGARRSCQVCAAMDKTGKFVKRFPPFISAPPAGYTAHFRDPQAFSHGGEYRMLLGAQNETLQGKILVYKSKDARNWKLSGELDFSERFMGYMIECPNLVFVDGRPILIFCPQGLAQSVAPYPNIHPNMVLVGDAYDDETNTILSDGTLRNFDDGFEFYAAQAMTAPDGRVLAVGWVGLPDTDTPTEKENWAHCLSLIRELTLKEGRLFSYPVKETETLRKERRDISVGGNGIWPVRTMGAEANRCELELRIPEGVSGSVLSAADENGENALTVSFDSLSGEVCADRSAVTGWREQRGDTVRKSKVSAGRDMVLNIFIDRSVFEIFINKGEKSITGRFFPQNGNGNIFITAKAPDPGAKIKGSFWGMEASVKF
ncbi:MAG: sucrose-6-phosphate hydrolase [Clostridiales Family XIII bacterium]|jgi:beta-fructofuranosidase|nr:sucrose-6-phosphate hydrolase [Clostridiales Family XIII bacterium]